MFDKTKPIYRRPDNSFDPGGLLVTLNNGEEFLLINEGSPFWDGKEPAGLREEVLEFITNNPKAVQPEPVPIPEPEPTQPPPPELTPEEELEQLKHQKLLENSMMCRDIIINSFVSDIKGDGLQPYRFNEDDHDNILGMVDKITLKMMKDPSGESIPMFAWKNNNQLACNDPPDWHFTHILELFDQFGDWKTLVLKRQDQIKVNIIKLYEDKNLKALEKFKIDYSDLIIKI